MLDRVAGILLLLVPLAAGAQAPVVAGSTTNLSSHPANQTSPSVHGTRVVWTDARNADLDVWARDLAGGLDQAISESGGPRAADYLSDVGDRYAVWTRAAGVAGGGADILAYDFTTASVVAVATGPEPELEPAVSGSWVAYAVTDAATGESRIRATNLAGGITVDVAGSPGVEALFPSISGTRVAYALFDGLTQAIEVADISSGSAVVVYHDGNLSSTRDPDIDGDRVAYLVPAAGNPAQMDIRVHDLLAGTTETLSRPGDQGWPKISGDWLAFEEAGAILLAHVPTMSGGQVYGVPASGASNQQLEDLQGGRVVYQAVTAAGDFDVFLYEFSAVVVPPPPAGFNCAAAIASGAAPLFDQTFLRKRGRPSAGQGMFNAAAGGGVVCVDNGTGAGGHRSSAATVWLNGTPVVTPAQLNQQVAAVEAQVVLKLSNTAKVTVAGAPGSVLRVRIFGAPGAPPAGGCGEKSGHHRGRGGLGGGRGSCHDDDDDDDDDDHDDHHGGDHDD